MPRWTIWAFVCTWGTTAFAAEGDEDLAPTFGGGVTTGLQGEQGFGYGTILSQVEFDAWFHNDLFEFRLDLDFHVDPIYFVDGANEDFTLSPHYPIPPEYAQLQIGRQKYRLRLGVTNPNIGLQEWDERDNYLVTYSGGWDFQPGQNLGVEPGVMFDDGTEIFAWAGYDLSWFTPSGGVGFATDQDDFSTWTGVDYMPDLRYLQLVSANSVYPTDWLALVFEVNAGLVETDPVGGGEITAAFLSEDPINFAVRVDHQRITPAASEILAISPAQTAVAATVNVMPLWWLQTRFEGKESWPQGGADPYFTGTLLVDAQFGTIN